MGLIEKDIEDINPLLRITPDGVKAYSEQRFHSISASLYEAKQSRRITYIAIAISVASLIVSSIL